MNATRQRRRRLAALALGIMTLPGVVHGCSAPTAPAQAPGGGTRLELSFAGYVADVAPVISRRGCDAGGDCHGGGIRGTLELSPADAKNLQFDFDHVAIEVSASRPDSSLILTEPLAIEAGGTPHAIKPFATTSESDYQAIRGWILAGVRP